jgi:D-sedoheptulose 7-phosphate isomerase
MSTSSLSTSYLGKLAGCLHCLNREELDRGIELIRAAWQKGQQIVTLGNGGSAMTALHFITDWNKMTHLATGKPFRGRTLLDNIGMVTAYGNDLSYADIFAEQIKNIAVPGDLVIAISGSGNSENVIRAVTAANELGCQTLWIRWRAAEVNCKTHDLGEFAGYATLRRRSRHFRPYSDEELVLPRAAH